MREIKNVVHFDSHIPHHQKFGRVVGALTGAYRHSIGVSEKKQAIVTVLKDFFQFGMSKQLATATVHRLITNTCDFDVWLPIYGCIHKHSNNIMDPSTLGHDLASLKM